MWIFKTHFISGVPFVSDFLSIEVVIWTILLLGEFWGKWLPDASLVRRMYISLCSALL